MANLRNPSLFIVVEVFNTYTGDILIKLGYEEDRNWIENL